MSCFFLITSLSMEVVLELNVLLKPFVARAVSEIKRKTENSQKPSQKKKGLLKASLIQQRKENSLYFKLMECKENKINKLRYIIIHKLG